MSQASASAKTLFDDGNGVRLPASWRLQSRSGAGTWADVPGAGGYPAAANTYNTVTFPAVDTSALRVVLQSNGTSSVGLLEVKAFAS